MDTVADWLRDALDFARAGFAQVNTIQYLVVALIAALAMGRYGQILVMALMAVLVHLAVDALLPVVQTGGDLGQFRLPDFLSSYFWRTAALLYVGYLVAITVFYIVRRLLIRRRG